MNVQSLIRTALTTVVVVAAALIGYALWKHYMYSPWTRDGRVRAEIVHVAPDVSGLVAQVEVRDNQLVKAGQVLFRYVEADGRPAAGGYPANPNGSAGDVAGLCNRAGNVWGLMPHPEDHVVGAQDPFRVEGRSGLPLFRALVERARAH